MSDISHKHCRLCGEMRSIFDYNKNPASRDGARTECKYCQQKHQSNYYLRTRKLKGTPGGVPAMNLTGQRFGRLTVIRRTENDNQGKAVWLCSCECGNNIRVRRGCLRKGQQSCGCYARDMASARARKLALDDPRFTNRRPPGEAARHELFQRYKGQARRKNHIFSLPKDIVLALFSSPCHYCGQPPSRIVRARGGDFLYTGLDRTDNTKGYIPGNVVPCCWTCNDAKKTRGYREFIDWTHRISERHKTWAKSAA